MNAKDATSGTDQFRSLQILDELSNDDSLTQRDLSSRLGIALGLINSYIKNLAAKGYITVKTIPSKRYAYYLTPKGFAEKTRLSYHLLRDYTRIYREAKKNLRSLFGELKDKGIHNVIFAGTDEVAEIAYITLQETNLELTGIIDPKKNGALFFGKKIKPLSSVRDMKYDCIIISTYLDRDTIYQTLLNLGVDKKVIYEIFSE